jgi:PEP-CTERM motif
LKYCFKIASLVVVALAITSFASADTLQLNGVNGATTPAGGEYVGPYTVSINSVDNQLFCLDLNRNTAIGETWEATPTVLSTSSTTQQKQAAILYSMIENGTLDQVTGQLEIWAIVDQTDAVTDGLTNSEWGFVNGIIKQDTFNTKLYGDSFYNQFVVYVAQDGTQSGGGIPQDFIGSNPPATPEPSSLFLLGTGLIGSAGAMIRKFRAN